MARGEEMVKRGRGRGKGEKERKLKYKALKDCFPDQEQNTASQEISIIFAELQLLRFCFPSSSISTLQAGVILDSLVKEILK